MNTPTSRPAAVAGTFYPADIGHLSQQLRGLLADAVAQHQAPKALIVPHAGYVYSGPIAAQAYSRLALLRWTIRRVVLLGPCHRVAVRGVALPACAFFDTPLGRIQVDTAAIATLAQQPGVVVDDRPHAQEHSLEVQLPFLQAVLENFCIIPIAIGQAAPEQVADLLEQLWGGPETLIVISSDLSHYHEYTQARAIDGESVSRILNLEPVLTHEQACGATGINALLLTARQRQLVPALLGVCNSGDTAGDRHRVVGYAAYAFTETPASSPQRVTTDDLGTALISQARDAIDRHLGLPPASTLTEHARLDASGACFVTLTLDGQLRGCIGQMQPSRALREDVRANAIAAASRDPRFTPLTAAEWGRVTLGISVLGPIEYLPCPDEITALTMIQPGQDGVVLVGHEGTRHSTFLPAVWRQIPQPQDFLRQLLNKGQFNAWPADMQIGRYQVREYHEPRI